MTQERAVARRKARERNNYIIGSVLATGLLLGIGYGVYKMMFDARGWLENNQRAKQPWERDPGGPSA